jgi:hypothetical protein
MKKIKVNFSDFWNDFDKEDNLFINLIREKYDVEISDEPNILFYSALSKNFLKYNCIRIFYTGENIRPNYSECDFSISFDFDTYNNRNYRFPVFLFTPPKYYIKPENFDVEKVFKTKTKFCSFIVSNPNCEERKIFFEKLSKYKKVDSGGDFLNNIGYKVKNKSDLLINYKFNIAFENSSYPGYTTEKIIEPIMNNNCIPIYWGNPYIEKDFNTKSFINVHDYNSFDEAIEKIIELDKDDDLYKEMLSQPFLHNNEIKEEFSYEKLKYFLCEIIDNLENIKKVATSYDKLRFIKFKIEDKLIKKILKNKN